MAPKDRQTSSSKDMKCFYCCLWRLKKRTNHQVTQKWYFPSLSLPCKVFLFHKVHRVGLKIRQLHRVKEPSHIFLEVCESNTSNRPCFYGELLSLESFYTSRFHVPWVRPKDQIQAKVHIPVEAVWQMPFVYFNSIELNTTSPWSSLLLLGIGPNTLQSL